MVKYFLPILLCAHAHVAYGDWPSESKKIDYLLAAIEKSDATFIRNGKEHEAKEAADHLRMKLKSAQTGFMSSGKDKWTANMFISKIASKSTMTGEPYFIKEKDATPVKAEEWLNLRLKEYDLSLASPRVNSAPAPTPQGPAVN